jgi:hypothetical protein
MTFDEISFWTIFGATSVLIPLLVPRARGWNVVAPRPELASSTGAASGLNSQVCLCQGRLRESPVSFSARYGEALVASRAPRQLSTWHLVPDRRTRCSAVRR